MNTNYLNTPVETIVEPPIDTKTQTLPLEKLPWEDFERLCLVIAQIDHNYSDCEIYGVKGQAQDGIDIYARKSNGKYSSYQCKRYQDFDLKNLSNAISSFKIGKFYGNSDKFYLCTSCELNKKQIQDKFIEYQTEFEVNNIELIKWDKINLIKILKDHPQIVYDFFGTEWVRLFNGELALDSLSKSKKLNAKQIVMYRNELYKFYSSIFNLQDRVIMADQLSKPYSIQERFITPDIISNIISSSNIDHNSLADTLSPSDISNLDKLYYDDYHFNNDTDFNFYNRNIKIDTNDNHINLRLSIDDAITDENKIIILGDPGAGKSTLLRYIVLDILSPSPCLKNISHKYGKLLPVWLPFAYITKQLTIDNNLSVSEILALWFKNYGKMDLFEIVKDALGDERLLLIIDGVDEWSSLPSAEQAIIKIEVLRELNGCKIIYSSRPYGFKMLKNSLTNSYALSLANFSTSQQHKFVRNMFSQFCKEKNMVDDSLVENQVNNFFTELDKASDLRNLSEIPLLLSILILQKIKSATLPKSKVEALKSLTEHLINQHRIKRINDAGISTDNDNDGIDFNDIFSIIADYIQRNSNDGVATKNEIQYILKQYLIDCVGYSPAKAKQYSSTLIDIGANDFGIIIEKSNDEISFSHKQFQEFLAAKFVFDSDEDSTIEYIKSHGANPVFYQVITIFFQLLPVRQIKKFGSCYEQLKNSNCENYQNEYVKLISYEVALNSQNTPKNILSDNLQSLITHFEYETDPSFKQALLKRILDGLDNIKISEEVQKFLIQYFPNKISFEDRRVTALKNISNLTPEFIAFLKKSLINGTIKVRYTTSQVINQHIKNRALFEFVKDIFLNCSNPDILSFAINCVISDQITIEQKNSLLDSVSSTNHIVQLFLFKNKIFSSTHNDDDLKNILALVNEIPYELRSEVSSLLINGYKENEILKNICISSVRMENRFRNDIPKVDEFVAWSVLCAAFNEDHDVIQLVKNEFDTSKYLFGGVDHHDILKSVLLQFKKSKTILAPSIEKWFDNINQHSIVGVEILYVSSFIKSEGVKQRLLKDLASHEFPYWKVLTLLEVWPDDVSIKVILKQFFRDAVNISAAAGFISKVLDEDDEKDEAIKILENILFDKNTSFRERTISALIDLDKDYFEHNILPWILQNISQFTNNYFNGYYEIITIIIANFHSLSSVKNFILEHVENDINLFNICIRYFPEEIKKVYCHLNNSLPLSKELRQVIINKFNSLIDPPKIILDALSKFDSEEDEIVKSDSAICLFNQIRNFDKSKILELSNPLIFAVGPNYLTSRMLAFTGYLITRNLKEYFNIINNEVESKRFYLFTDFHYRDRISYLTLQCIVDNFDYFISEVGENLDKMIKPDAQKTVEYIYGIISQCTTKSTQSYQYLLNFIDRNVKTITDSRIISFLNRISPKGTQLKEILLNMLSTDNTSNKILIGKLLGTNFCGDAQVRQEINKPNGYHDDGRIMALCYGWPDNPVLKKIYDDIMINKYHDVNSHVVFTLRFLFDEIDALVILIKHIFNQQSTIKGYHQYFLVPMIERLRKDTNFVNEIKALLFSSESIDEKISFYNMLLQTNMIDDRVEDWKNKITNFNDDYGYDIISNKVIRLKDVLHDYYF